MIAAALLGADQFGMRVLVHTSVDVTWESAVDMGPRDERSV